MADGLSIQPLVASGGFNWIFLIEILICCVLALFFLFYFNRLFATIVGYCIRAYTWHKYRAYIDISALQISLLGGRIFFKSIRYHANNITVLVYEGHVTWRYWLRLVQDAEVFAVEDLGRKGKEQSSGDDEAKSTGEERSKSRSRSVGKEEQAGGKPKKELPCRISVKVAGVEAFVYNRSPVYDMILEQTRSKAQAPRSAPEDDEKTEHGRNSSSSDSNEKKQDAAFGFTATETNTRDTTATKTSSHGHSKKPELPAFLRMLPVRIECRRAAAAVGNENTTSIIAAKLEKAAGTIDAGHSGPLDLYKLLFNFDMENINVTMKPNRDFKQLQLDAARRILREREAEQPKSKSFDFVFIRKAKKRWQALAHMFTRTRSVNGSLRTASMTSGIDGTGAEQDQVPGQTQWHGLARYLDDKEVTEHDEWKGVEYAKASTLADIEKLHMRFYFDMPGTVPDGAVDTASSAYATDINGSEPPDYGLDFAVHGGVVTYGPWADRQRINMQQILFPAPFVDATPAKALKPGENRNWSLFKIFISIEKDVTLRIPSREPSKDDKWQGRAGKSKFAEGQDNQEMKRKGKHGRRQRHTRRRKGNQGNTGVDARPYAWLDVTVKTDSTVSYVMDMFPHTDGYVNKLDCDIKGTEIASSVNHGLLWRTGAVSLDADLSQPVSWNSLRKWPFNITIDDLELFILRDHMFLIIDLVNDWSSGAPSDFYTFVPYIYSLRMLFRNFVIYLNANDANIVNDPAELEKNDFLTLDFGALDATLDINMDQYRPIRNMITFDVLATEMAMRMLSPTRSTFSAFLKDKLVAEMPKLTLSGSFSGHQEERYGLTDTLRFDIVGSGLSLKAYGFLVRQLINVKENYFGDYMHFKTLEEFQGADDDLAVANLKTASVPKPKAVNELDVMLCIIAEDATIMFPTNIYSADEFVRVELPVANLDLRIVSYYLDMGLQLSPISFLSGSSSSEHESASSTQMFVKHVDLDGHRAFGLPPDEPAYMNQWTIDVGAITGEFSSSFVHNLVMAGRAFIFGFEDRENALPLSSPSVFDDATFVQVRTDIVRIWLHVGRDAMLFSTEPIEVVTNDLAGDTFSQRVHVLVPKVTLACVDGKSASRYRVHDSSRGLERAAVRTFAFFETGISVTVIMRKLRFEEERRKQQAHIHEHDRRTGRALFLQRHNGGVVQPPEGEADFQPPAMPYPSLALPLDRFGNKTHGPASMKSVRSSVSDKQIRTKSSSSSLSASVRASGPGLQHPRIQNIDQGRDHTPSSQSMRSSSRASSADTTGRHKNVANDRTPSSTMAFSSSYSEPHFPLSAVKPDETKVPNFEPVPSTDGTSSETSSLSGNVAEVDVDQAVAQTSVIIKVIPGIRAYFEPRVVVTAAKLLRKALPKRPDEIMDAFQMDVLGAVSGLQDQHRQSNQALEIGIDLPATHLRALNPSASKHMDDDQLDVNLRSVETLVRTKSLPSASEWKEALAVHAKVASAEALLGPRAQLASSSPSVTASIGDVLVWLGIKATTAVHASAGETVLTVTAEQAEYLVDLVLRLLPLANEMKKKVDVSLTTYRDRLWLLVNTMMQHSEEVGDPIFLSRMTYILRAFPDHFRNQESWKIAVRLRHILQNLPPKLLDELKTQIKAAPQDTPAMPAVKAVEEWIQWRSWDVPNVHQTVAFQTIANDEELEALQASEEKPLMLTVRSEYLRLAVLTKGDSNEVVIEEASLGLDSTPPTAPTGLMLVEENTRTKTLVQMHSSSIAMLANWSALAIVECVLPEIEKLQDLARPLEKPGQRNTSQVLEDGLRSQLLHVVVSTDKGSVSLQSLNMRHLSWADGLKLSLIGTTQVGDQYGLGVSVMINADSASTELHGPSRCLWQTLLTSPSIYIDHVSPVSDAEVPPSMTVALSYEMLKISLLEQVPGLLQAVDSVILDEVSQVMKLVESAKSIPTDPAKQAAPNDYSSAPIKVHIALLAGELQLDVSLLQELKYQLQGTAASIRIAPSLSRDNAWGIDFDVGRQLHYLVNYSADESHEQTALDVPPINGHVGIELAKEATSLSVTTTMQRIDVDAAAIQSVFAVMSQSEVQNVISAIEAGVEEVQSHVEAIKPHSTKVQTPSPTGATQIAFDLRLALLGVRIATSTQTQGSSTAEVEFGIGPVHAVATNRKTLAEGGSLVPEVRAQIRDIGASLMVRQEGKQLPCGNISFGLQLHFKSQLDNEGKLARELMVQSHGFEVGAYPDTAATIVDVVNHLEDKIKGLDLTKEREYLHHLRSSRRPHKAIQKISGKQMPAEDGEVAFSAVDLLSVTTTVEITDIQIAWLVPQSYASGQNGQVSDLVLSLDRIELNTRGGQEAKLTIEDLQLQLAKRNTGLTRGSMNSALLPEVSFSVAYWSVGKNRNLAFRAAGKPLEIRLESKFIVPVSSVQKSIVSAIEKFKVGTATWKSMPTSMGAPRAELFDSKLLASLLVEADFAGAIFYLQGSGPRDNSLATLAASSQQHGSQHGRYGQFAADGSQMHTTLKAPGIAMKLEYHRANDGLQPTLHGEVCIEASTNKLLPNVVPLILEISNSVKEVMQNQNDETPAKPQPTAETKPTQRFFEDESIVNADPEAYFGKTKVNLGFRICRQEFALTCQPIARVDAKAQLDDFYVTMNTIESDEHGHFFAISAMVTSLNAQVKHMYSREPTFTFDMDSIVLSVLNSKHLSGTSGISAVLKINPTRTFINGKQLQDLLLFREIWLPPEIRASSPSSPPPQPSSDRPEDIFAQRYQSVSAAAAFPWNATVSIAELSVDLDLGQSIGKSSFTIKNLWASQTKSSNWEQNLCVGMEDMAMNSTGRMSGFISLSKLGVRTSIKFPQDVLSERKTPLIQASAGFQRLRAKAAFDYQAFAFGDIEGFDFLMYNVHPPEGSDRDRLVGVLDCEKAYVFCTSTSSAQAVGLYQAFERLIQEKQQAYIQSLRDIEKHLRRQSTVVATRFGPQIPNSPILDRSKKSSVSLHTDVVLTMGSISFGVFPSTFFDSQILKLEANNIQARFAVGLKKGRIQSVLGMTLGQLQVALASARRVTAVPRALDITVDDVVGSAVNARGGTILRVPKVVASMQTWQAPDSNSVDYIFKSLFDGKIDVGWNLSRIDFIKNMYLAHSRSLASRLGKALPESAVKITAGPVSEGDTNKTGDKNEAQEKITAEVNLPQSRYEYNALETPVIETPQLRDMGEATPPLEWIGLHRERLPNVTHQIIIVSLLEVAKEVEDAYERILGSS
ncbi:Macrophage colony-stimulating factor 1 receptor [Vermiconidia calcicola]|uniref:Macrophage colony-stimulating factor 1 receptor n=1 Tax=Vermiconidia calcicola TaxID=1690605 RepID=A0ACC3NRC6_9PEZI|nr:Macrophage colony-stimulating factor 1 receptor [Vermiconidia calcicola]